MTKYFKATRPDGTDFHTGTIDYGSALVSGELVRHPGGWLGARTADCYLSVATVPTDCTGFTWPARLFEVMAYDEWSPEPGNMPNKRATLAIRVVAELPAHLLFGPQGAQVERLIERASTITYRQSVELSAAWSAERVAAPSASQRASRTAAWSAAQSAAHTAAHGAALRAEAHSAAQSAAWCAAQSASALCARDLIAAAQFKTLTTPWVSVMGEL